MRILLLASGLALVTLFTIACVTIRSTIEIWKGDDHESLGPMRLSRSLRWRV